MGSTQPEPNEIALSVIIPCLNAAETLEEQLDALAIQEYSQDWEILVVDNGSTDGTGELVEKRMLDIPQLRLVPAFERSGASYARNTGVENARGSKLLFCDGDDAVHPGWVQALSDGLDRYPVVTGSLDVETLNSRVLAESRGPGGVRATFYGLFPTISGCSFGVQRNVYEKVGGYDERFWPCEDVMFAMVMNDHGFEVGFISEAVVAYRYRTEPSTLWRQGNLYGFGRVHVAVEARERGMKLPRFSGWRSWLWLLGHLPYLASSANRGAWIWVAGNRWGQIRGSLKFRMLMI